MTNSKYGVGFWFLIFATNFVFSTADVSVVSRGENRTVEARTLHRTDGLNCLSGFLVSVAGFEHDTRLVVRCPAGRVCGSWDAVLSSNVPKSPVQNCMSPSLDLIFLLDGSGSIGRRDFSSMLRWVTQVASHFNLTDGEARIGVIQYSEKKSVRTEIQLGQYTDQENFNRAVVGIRRKGGPTFTAHALNYSALDFQRSDRFNDSSTAKALILITDGRASDSVVLPQTASYVRSLGITIFAVGVGNAVLHELVRTVATGDLNSTERVYIVNDFASLAGLTSQIQHLVQLRQDCNETQTVNITPATAEAGRISSYQCLSEKGCRVLNCNKIKQFLPPSTHVRDGSCTTTCCYGDFCNIPRSFRTATGSPPTTSQSPFTGASLSAPSRTSGLPVTTQVISAIRGIQQRITASISNWYSYRYDGGAHAIADGGRDMFDSGNKISLRSGYNSLNVAYNQTYRFAGFESATEAGYPFVAVTWINNSPERRSLTIRFSGNPGSDGGGSSQIYSGNFRISSFFVYYKSFQIYGAGDPTICEVYFNMFSPSTWNSEVIQPPTVTFNSNTRDLSTQIELVAGRRHLRNVLVGYTLLSRYPSKRVEKSEIENVLREIAKSVRNIDINDVETPEITPGPFTTTAFETTGIPSHTLTTIIGRPVTWQAIEAVRAARGRIINSYTNWYSYRYDGDAFNIRDGGHDMFDGGNRITIRGSGLSRNVAYNHRYSYGGLDVETEAGNPFVAFIWVDDNPNQRSIEVQFSGNPGSDGRGSSQIYRGNFRINSFFVYYQSFQIYGAGDSTICEVYFNMFSQSTWNSEVIQPPNVTFNSNTNFLRAQIVFVAGRRHLRNVLLGYTLLSRYPGVRIEQFEIERVLREMALSVRNIDVSAVEPTEIISGASTTAVFETTAATNSTTTARCGFVATARSYSQPLNSPRWPSSYSNSQSCTWVLTAPYRSRIRIEFISFRTEQCCDYLSIKENGREVRRFKGTLNRPSPYTSTSYRVTLFFRAVGSVTNRGFQLTYQAVQPTSAPLSTTSPTTTPIMTTPIRHVTTTAASCGFVAIAKNYTQYLNSPHWPSSYSNSQNCTWILTAPLCRARIRIDFISFRTEQCCDYLSIKENSREVRRFKGTLSRSSSYTSTSNFVTLFFRSDHSITNRGFQLTFRTVQPKTITVSTTTPPTTTFYVTTPSNAGTSAAPCGFVAVARSYSQFLYSPGWPNSYSNHQNCTWTLTAHYRYRIRIDFISFRTEQCCDYLSIKENNREVRRFKGTLNRPSPYTSTSYRVTLFFRSDGSVTNRGFQLAYQAVRTTINA